MKISLNLLSKFINITENNVDKIKEIITIKSAEVETMKNISEFLDNVVVGEIKDIKTHPNADKLKITVVNDGKEDFQVVCGGTNLKIGMKIAFAKLGAIVKWHGTETIKMEKAKIRGEESFGMICAAEELGLENIFPKSNDHEIVDLSNLNCKIGTNLSEALNLNDYILDIDNHAITNRPDLFSHRGFAREFIANNLGEWNNKFKIKEIKEGEADLPVQIKIESNDLCSNYLAIHIKNIEVKDSPNWLKQQLINCDINPISNIVDITNYVMLELGMPLHAFDLNKVNSKNWTMRKSKKGEKIITLDEKELELNNESIVFDNGNQLFDLCGIMGALNSGVNKDTNEIILHAPIYNQHLIRKTARNTGKISDASTIYEKGIDNELAMDGLLRAINLIQEICPNAKIESKIFKIKNYEKENRIIKLKLNDIYKISGIEIEINKIKNILNNLGFKAQYNNEIFIVDIPSWRLNDVIIKEDLIEEILRVYGYDNIETKSPKIDIQIKQKNNKKELNSYFKEKLISFGFNELSTFSFLGKNLINKTGINLNEKTIKIQNPISSDLELMRQSLLPYTLEIISNNLRYKNTFGVFELSNIYNKENNESKESKNLIIANVAKEFKELQSIMEYFNFQLKRTSKENLKEYQHPGRTADLIMRGKTVGYLYELHPQINKNFNIKTRIHIAEINMDMLYKMKIKLLNKYTELNKYPAIKLDISILINKKDEAKNYLKIIQKADKTLIENIEIIDEYEGEKIEKDKRSLTFSITYRSKEKTLSDIDVNQIHTKVLENLKNIGAVIRD